MKALAQLSILVALLGACGDTQSDLEGRALEAKLQSLADAAGLAIRDVSVPFERLDEAPARLRAVYGALTSGPPGVYLMRYSDDTLHTTLHVFVITASRQTYVRLSTSPRKSTRQEQHSIRTAHYAAKSEVQNEALVLDTPEGVIRLTPEDVTSVGA